MSTSHRLRCKEFLALASAAFAIRSASAQCPGQTLIGDSAQGFFGTQLHNVGDADGDGIDDLIASQLAFGSTGSKAFLYSGGSMTLIRTHEGVSEFEGFGGLGGAGDVDLDGFADYVGITGVEGGLVTVYSGKTGAVLWSALGDPGEGLGSAAATIGDLDGDGRPDLLVGAEESNTVVVFDADGNVITKLVGKHDSGFGASIAAAGDLDSDGVPDFFVGAPLISIPKAQRFGAAIAMSAATMKPLYCVRGEKPDDQLGDQIARLGDVDGDGVSDMAVGGGIHDIKDGSQRGVVVIVSGRKGKRLRTIRGDNDGDEFGSALGGMDDVDGDGVPDLVVGASGFRGVGGTFVGIARIYSGKTGAVLFQWDGVAGTPTDHKFGSGIMTGNLNGDGQRDLVIADYEYALDGKFSFEGALFEFFGCH